MSIGIFYGSSGGATESVAEQIKNALDLKADLHDIADIDVDVFSEYSHVIIGTSTWGDGELQDDWDDKFSDYNRVDFSGKTVAFFGLGDQDGYEECFLDGMGTLHDAAVKNGAKVVGDNWSSEDYDFEESTAIKDGAFVGLAIDEDNQDELTEERIQKWADIIKPSFQ